jgi:hypothetical protein
VGAPSLCTVLTCGTPTDQPVVHTLLWLVLCPLSPCPGSQLSRALGDRIGWERLVKRGLHTLVKPEYQVWGWVVMCELRASPHLRLLQSRCSLPPLIPLVPSTGGGRESWALSARCTLAQRKDDHWLARQVLASDWCVGVLNEQGLTNPGIPSDSPNNGLCLLLEATPSQALPRPLPRRSGGALVEYTFFQWLRS